MTAEFAAFQRWTEADGTLTLEARRFLARLAQAAVVSVVEIADEAEIPDPAPPNTFYFIVSDRLYFGQTLVWQHV